MNAHSYFSVPQFCPECSSSLFLEGDFLFCKNPACPAQLAGCIKVWIRNLGLLHWGDTLVNNLVSSQVISVETVADLYKLTPEQIALHCSGLKMATKCYDILHSNKELPLELVIASMNIPNFGRTTATDIVQAGYDTLDKVLSITFDELCSIPNVASKTADSILLGLQTKSQLLRDLEEVINIKKPVEDGPLKGKIVVITGELSAPRKQVEKQIMDAGGFPKGSVTKQTHFLVTNNPSSGSSKLRKASQYGVQIIDEKTLMSMI